MNSQLYRATGMRLLGNKAYRRISDRDRNIQATDGRNGTIQVTLKQLYYLSAEVLVLDQKAADISRSFVLDM